MALTPVNNGGFETAGATPGSADGWTVDQVASAGSYAAYDADGVDVAREAFEPGWDNTDFILEFEPVDLEAASYIPFNNDFEDMEGGWSQNEDWVDELISTETAQYDTTPQDWEDFEDDWNTDPYHLDWSTVPNELGVYTPGAKGYEDMEEEWGSNENYWWTWADLEGQSLSETALFDVGTPESFEDFEEEWPDLVMTTY